MAQRFLAPSVTFEGIISQNGTINNDSHLITRSWAKGNVINGIHTDSANYAEVVAESGVNKLKLKPLVITSVTVNSAQADLAAFISNVYSGSNFQEGDIVFLTTPSPTEAYIHNGGTAGTAADFDQLNQGLSDAQIRSKFSGSAGINYNNSTGAITADQAEIRAFFSGSAGVNYDAGTGAITADQTEIRGMLSATGLLSYSGGAFGLTAANVRTQISDASGSLCHYNQSTGVIEMTNADVRGALAASGESDEMLDYVSGSGSFSLNESKLRKEFNNQSLSAGVGLALTHNLNKRLVHVSAMDSSGNHVDLEIVYTSTTVATVKSTVALSGVEIAVSI